MPLSSPDAWRNLTRVNVSLDAVTGSPGIDSAPSGAFGRSARVRSLNDDTDRDALFLTGNVEAAAGGDPGSAARNLFSALGVAPDSATGGRATRTAAVTGSRAGSNVLIQQQIQGHDVVGANVKVNIAPSGAFVVTGRPIGDLASRVPKEPASATPEQAAAAAAEAFDLEPSAVVDTKLEVFPVDGGGSRWAYRVGLVIEDPCADVRAYVDAVDLRLLLSFNIASALRGKATVYRIDPLRTPELARVSIADIGPEPADQLAGNRIVVTPGMTPGIARPDRDFRMAETDPGFDEANAFYHLRTALRYFGSLRGRRRFPSPPFRPIRAVVRDPMNPDNAFFRPLKNDLRFGDVGPRPTARSADIIHHEFAHAVSDVAARLGRAPMDAPSRGLSEGYSDYFAASILGDPRFGTWVSPPHARDASDRSLRFPPGFEGSEHAVGAVWAAMLWEVRAAVGPRDCDRIAFESLFLLSPQSTFEDGLAALIAADSQLVAAGQIGGSHAAAIRAEFERRR